MSTIKRRYLIQDIIYEGNTSHVYKGFDKKKNRNVAIKIVSVSQKLNLHLISLMRHILIN